VSDAGAEDVSFVTADDVRRLNAELDARLVRLAGEIRPDELHVDPQNGEWTLAENLGHIAEFPRFFAPQLEAQLHDELRADLAASLDAFAAALVELRDDDLERVAENGKYGPESLAVFLDRYVISHKAAHVRQLRETIDAVRAVTR
jgi:uncharacterized damage-inducible protein DinB